MKRCKILYAASTLSHLDRFHVPYIEALRKKHEVFLMASEGEGVDFPLRFHKRFFSISNLKTVKKIRRIIKSEGFDRIIVHTTLAAFMIRLAMVGIRKRNRPPVLNVVHGYLFSLPVHGRRARFLLGCEKLLRSKTDELALMNEEDLYLAKKYRLCEGKLSFMNGMGISIPFDMQAKDPYLRRVYAPGEKDFLCTFVGELSERKNQIFLIRAAKRLYEEGVPIRLLLIGEGEGRAALEAEARKLCIEDRVYMPGERENVYPYLGVTDLYVSASTSEGLPFNIMEAMACGLPMLVSDVKGQRDLLEGHREFLYRREDADAFCKELKHIYESGVCGMGSYVYQNLEDYLLVSVFDKNLKILAGDI